MKIFEVRFETDEYWYPVGTFIDRARAEAIAERTRRRLTNPDSLTVHEIEISEAVGMEGIDADVESAQSMIRDWDEDAIRLTLSPRDLFDHIAEVDDDRVQRVTLAELRLLPEERRLVIAEWLDKAIYDEPDWSAIPIELVPPDKRPSPGQVGAGL